MGISEGAISRTSRWSVSPLQPDKWSDNIQCPFSMITVITVMISMFPQTNKDESNLPSSADQPCPMHPKQPFERKSSSSLQHCLRLLGRWTLSLGTLLSSPLAVWTSSTPSWDGRSMGEEHLQTRSIWIQLKIVRTPCTKTKTKIVSFTFPLKSSLWGTRRHTKRDKTWRRNWENFSPNGKLSVLRQHLLNPKSRKYLDWELRL